MTTPPPPSTGPAPGKGGSLVSKLGGSRNAAIIGAGATVAVVALLASMRSKGGTTGTTSMTTADGFDSSPYDMWNAWQEEYEDLQEEINAGGTTTATGPGKPPKSTLPAPIPKPPIPKPAPKPPPPKPKPKSPAHKVVTVKHGDTLSGIAKKNHISMATLKKLNPVYWTNKKYKNGNSIWAGDKVKV